ncbi:MAG: hypothetical protein Ct9H300mP12_06770 [Acidimicrobiales bacterium]|nr:MAG: hypothetical protein Ct9H300mP12_06770 [Acidimicrobiales bacterium]
MATYPPLHGGGIRGVWGAILPLQSQEESMPQVEANGLMLEVEEFGDPPTRPSFGGGPQRAVTVWPEGSVAFSLTGVIEWSGSTTETWG